MNAAWVALAPALPLGMTLLNLVTWPALRPSAAPRLRYVALLPARDEAANIEACVRAVLATRVDAVCVYDDASTDDTPLIVGRLALEDPRVTLLRGQGPPPGWRGKPYACHRLAQHALSQHAPAAKGQDTGGPVLLFLDADVRVTPDLCDHLDAGLLGVDALTAVPRQVCGTDGERLVLPLLHLTYESWLPLALIPHVRATSVLAANGQVLAVRAGAYEACGGFGAVRADVVDDMAFCRRLKVVGRRVRFSDGHRFASCRMYDGFSASIDGFSKNLYPGLGGHPAALVAVLGLYAACFVLPWIALPWAPVAGALGIGANLLQRVVMAVRHRQGWLPVVAHLASIGLFFYIAVRSAVWSWTGRGSWRGRSLVLGGERSVGVGEVA